MKNKGFTLIELLAVIIILAVIALIATPIVLNVVNNAQESARKSSVAGFADATKLAITEYQFKEQGSVPTVDNAFIGTITYQGDRVVCGQDSETPGVYYSKSYGIVLHGCKVGDNDTLYYFGSGKVYTKNADNTLPKEFEDIFNNAQSGGSSGGGTTPSELTVSDVSNVCAKNGNTCSIAQIKGGVSMNVEVKPGEKHKFYILNDNGTELTLLMDRNLDLNSDGIADDKLEWNSSSNYTVGPVQSISKLEEMTKLWTNLEDRSYSYIGTDANSFNGCNPYSSCPSNAYTIADRTAKARMVSVQELIKMGCTAGTNSCPTWVYDYTQGNTNDVNTEGYWTSNASTISITGAWYVTSGGSFYDTHLANATRFGVRPVITVAKSYVK